MVIGLGDFKLWKCVVILCDKGIIKLIDGRVDIRVYVLLKNECLGK